ncbi:hypothetical protein A6R68_18819 [Neotoma lepida]|uniref:USP domain-containing protein n=1 Tax=Neotoma lepida TaxID=56216 RepID=A0A1A6HLG8_NEOLE|nr:hypothetical protein A6R68_18819 [Neotoma lepida]
MSNMPPLVFSPSFLFYFQYSEDMKHKTTLLELQKMFTYLMDCEHVSQTAEEFYTVRCQVADMKNIYESLDEVTIKDTLEGDNMYTCSHCGKKVRAEKR